ncbi:MAG TPA: NUDIX domain-containing protein [Conexibacter sp.]|jgi:predicted NUDIX family NTP pyrophosphohydrolase|nr:NUDIX domain-containing protein [Conexibacter sp.]
MARRSAGIVLFRRSGSGELEVLLVHPGGPFWARRDAGAWSIPKGEVEPDEEERAGALRELAEETGATFADVSEGDLITLGEVRQRSGKVVTAWALERDLDADAILSTTFELEWPPRSGRLQTFPEVDRAAWLPLPAAREKLLPAQAPWLDRLAAILG